MFISIRSPRGGNPLTSLWAGINKARNIKLEPEKKPEIVGDMLSFKIGYAVTDIKKGDSIYFTRSEAKKLKTIIRSELLD